MSGDVTLMPFLINVLEALNAAPLSSKQSARMFLFGTSEMFPRSVVLPATVLQPGMFFSNLYLSLRNLVQSYFFCLFMFFVFVIVLFVLYSVQTQ
jgi:hypothetical protein